jgi:2-dehydropantoate 2-reductase
VESNAHAWSICQDLIREICAAAAGEGAVFDPEEQILRVQDHLRKAPGGFTSIYSDIKNGRKTEADFICGAVVRAAQDQGLRVPVQETILRLVHAMEER